MKKNKLFVLLCIVITIMVASMTGCGKTQTGQVDSSEGETVNYEQTVFDRTVTEGKLAVYYMSSGLAVSSWYNQTAGGDMMIMIMPDGKTALIDCGHQGEGAHVLNRLEQLGIEKFDYCIVSHPHTDHLGGYSIILRHMEIGHVYMPPVEVMNRADYVAQDFVKDIEALNIPYTHLASGDVVDIAKDVTMKVYNPEVGFDADATINLNESSLLLKFVYKESSFLMNGDIANNTTHDNGYPTEEKLVEKWGDELQADVSKVGHHGNADSMSSMIWRETVKAKIYVTISTFPRDYGEHEKNLKAGGLSLNTALDGDLVIYTTGDGTYDVQVSRDRTAVEYELLDTKDGFMHVE